MKLTRLTATLGVGISLVALPTIAGASTLPTTSNGFRFVDDAGATIELDAVPERIVMFEDVAASLMDLGVRPAGIDFLAVGNELLDDFDLDGIATVGDRCGAINLEAVAALEPDLFIYMNWGESDGTGALFCLDEALRRELETFAPVVVMNAEGDAEEILGDYIDLAAALGADLEAPEIVANRQRYEAAAQRLSEAVAARPEISVIPMSISADAALVAEIGGFADLVTLRDRFGVRFASPFAVDEYSGTYWAEYSAETVTEIRGDVILLAAKNPTPPEERIAAFPLWAALPEVEAGQVVDWWVPGSFSYTRDAEFMESLATAIDNAEDFVTEDAAR